MAAGETFSVGEHRRCLLYKPQCSALLDYQARCGGAGMKDVRGVQTDGRACRGGGARLSKEPGKRL